MEIPLNASPKIRRRSDSLDRSRKAPARMTSPGVSFQPSDRASVCPSSGATGWPSRSWRCASLAACDRPVGRTIDGPSPRGAGGACSYVASRSRSVRLEAADANVTHNSLLPAAPAFEHELDESLENPRHHFIQVGRGHAIVRRPAARCEIDHVQGLRQGIRLDAGPGHH